MIEEKSCAARMEKVTGTFSFTVEGWSALPDKVGESTESPEFELCGKSWQLRIFPGGSLDAHINYVSFYLASKSSTLTRASYKLIIKNQNNGSNDEVFASAGIRKFEAKGIQVDGWGRDKFIAASQLKDAWVGLCVSDTVVFKVEITVFGGLTPITQCLTNGVPICTLSQSLLHAYQDPTNTFADVSLCVNSEIIRVHKTILCARSDMFRAMFNSRMLEASTGTVEIEGIDVAVVKELVNFIYTDVISSFAVLDNMLLELYTAANRYQVNGLLSICENRMIENLAVDTCIDTYRVADTFEAVKLKSQVMQYIVQHYVDVCSTEQYKFIVSNFDKEEPCTRMLNDMNAAVANSHAYRVNCLGNLGSILTPGSAASSESGSAGGGGAVGAGIGHAHSAVVGDNHNNHHRHGNGQCIIS